MTCEIAGGLLSNRFKEVHRSFNIQQAATLQCVTQFHKYSSEASKLSGGSFSIQLCTVLIHDMFIEKRDAGYNCQVFILTRQVQFSDYYCYCIIISSKISSGGRSSVDIFFLKVTSALSVQRSTCRTELLPCFVFNIHSYTLFIVAQKRHFTFWVTLAMREVPARFNVLLISIFQFQQLHVFLECLF